MRRARSFSEIGSRLAAAGRRLVFARPLKRRRQRRRLVELQDGLRVVHAAEENGTAATIDALAGSLSISRERARELLRELAERGLVRVADVIELTPAGRRSARAVVRAHRLWERYLADEIGTPAAELHRLADEREHRLDPDAIERLAAQLGYPQRDPHGDPIPTAAGELDKNRGVPLSVLAAGHSGEIVHIEDEPPSSYASISAAGLEVGRAVTVREARAGRLVIDVDGEAVELDGIDAAAVLVAPRPWPSGRPWTLADLRVGEEARITELRVSGFGRRRLQDLGFTKGARVTRVLTSPFGEPTAYRVRSTVIALRPEQARRVEIASLTEGEEPTP